MMCNVELSSQKKKKNIYIYITFDLSKKKPLVSALIELGLASLKFPQ